MIPDILRHVTSKYGLRGFRRIGDCGIGEHDSEVRRIAEVDANGGRLELSCQALLQRHEILKVGTRKGSSCHESDHDGPTDHGGRPPKALRLGCGALLSCSQTDGLPGKTAPPASSAC